MIRFIVAFMAIAVPATAQQAPVTFVFGKTLPLGTGQWNYAAGVSGGEARFGAHFSLRCDRAARTMVVSRLGTPPAALTIATDMQTRTLPADGRLSANDPILDAMAFSRGRIIVTGGSAGALAVPSWPEAARAIEDCRN